MAPPLLPPPACQGQTAKGKSSGKLGGGDSDGLALGRHRLQRRDMAHAAKQRRLSSALSAKASTLRSSSLDLCIRFSSYGLITVRI